MEELEALASDLHKDPSNPDTPIRIARRLLGSANVREVDLPLPGDGALARIRDTWQIWIRRDLPPERQGFAVAHEVAEYVLRGSALESERNANRLAASILAPREHFLSAAWFGPSFAELARSIVATETLIALRWGEVTEQPVRVQTARYTWERGRPFAWEDPPARIVKVPIRDARKRTAWLALT